MPSIPRRVDLAFYGRDLYATAVCDSALMALSRIGGGSSRGAEDFAANRR